MFMISSTMRIFVCREVTDMRRSFDRLSVMVEDVIKENPTSGHLFVFCNRRCDRLKMLYWDRNGYCLIYKRLEEGTFRLPSASVETGGIEIDSAQLVYLLEGVEVVKQRKRYRRKKTF